MVFPSSSGTELCSICYLNGSYISESIIYTIIESAVFGSQGVGIMELNDDLQTDIGWLHPMGALIRLYIYDYEVSNCRYMQNDVITGYVVDCIVN